MTNKKEYTPEDIVTYKHNTRNTGITSYNKISLIRSLSGIACIGIGLITSPVPMTTIPLIVVGSWLLGYDSRIILGYLNHKGKSLLNWVYCNRTPKKLKRTIKTRLLL